MKNNPIVIIGGGPAGLAAAYELSKNNVPCILLEEKNKLGGIARTESFKGYHFDLGGHRFFTKSAEINQIWQEALGQDFITRSRLSRIYYRRKFFNYPLKPLNAFLGLGMIETGRILTSYFWQKLFPYPQENNFEEWVSNRFGRRLYQIFFKSYTEKVWGLSCKEIGAEWAAQRIKGLSLSSAIVNAFLGGRKRAIKTLIDKFEYPKYGPGMMWDKMAEVIKSHGGEIRLNSRVTALELKEDRVVNCQVNGNEKISCKQVISSMPLRELMVQLSSFAKHNMAELLTSLKYRAFLIVALIIQQEELFPDNWIYIHSPEVKLGRVQNFKNWSPQMVPVADHTCLGLEYFCNYADELWNSRDQYLISLATEELIRTGLLDDGSKVVDGTVLRVKDAYPVYDAASTKALPKIKESLSKIENLQTIGRAGMHRYNNMDHSMLTGLFAARNILQDRQAHDLWEVNAEQDYHETA